MQITNKLKYYLRKIKNLFIKFRNKLINPRKDSKFFKQKLVAGNYLPFKDNSFIKWIDRAGNYQYDSISAGINLDNTNRDIAFDIGANIGITTRLLSQNYRLVIALEPSSQNRAAIFRNQISGVNNVLVYPFAASSKSGNEKIRISDSSCGGNSLSDVDLPNPDRFEDIELVKIDDLIIGNIFFKNRNISFIKLDIQGYELLALKGAEKIINQFKPTIICEVMTSFYSNEEKIDNFLITKGYEKVLSFGKDRIYKFPIKNKVQNI